MDTHMQYITTPFSMMDLATRDLSAYANSEDKAPHILNNASLTKHLCFLFLVYISWCLFYYLS